MRPRLLYIGDVPIEASYHGSLFLFRLLESYSVERLTIVETGRPSQSPRRIPGVNYISIPLANERWLNTRFHPYVMAWYSFRSVKADNRMISVIRGVRFDSILTVAHGVGWLTAASLAGSIKVPFHLVVHDDWPRVAAVPHRFRNWLDKRFANVYREAASRMCVSPSMRTRYFERYGCDSDVIYPTRAQNCCTFDQPAVRLTRNNKPFTVAFAGTINSEGYVRALIRLREALATVKGRLLIFGPMTQEKARQSGLEGANVVLGGLIRSEDLIARLREDADALFVPMSFSPEDRPNMEKAFPSKLADYTATGLPLVIYGPDYCSAVCWARENVGSAEVVEVEDDGLLISVIQRLAGDPAIRLSLGRQALAVGQRYFAQGVAQQIFEEAVSTSKIRVGLS